MRFKYYLRGAGIGIIIAVLIMVVGGSNNRTMSDGEIIRRAQELGMVKAEEGATVKQYNEKSSSAEGSSQAEASSEAPAEPSSVAASSAAPASSAAASSAASTASSAAASAASSAAEPGSSAEIDAPSDGTKVSVSITSGMLSDKVAEKLQSAGLIADAKEFNKYLISKGYDRQIIKGEYVIEKGATYEEIARMITTKTR